MAGDEPGAGRFLEFAGGIRDVLGFRRVGIGDGALVAKLPAALRSQTLEADCSLPGA
jgi:hypothetical protein